VEWALWDSGGGWAPKNKILQFKPTQRNNFCLLDFSELFTLQEISDGVNIFGYPIAWFRAWVKWEAQGDSLSRPGWAQPDIHKQTHFHLYVLEYNTNI
jgi:hypothetical protein